MEVFSGSGDPSIFLLVTRWSDIESYRIWHGSEAHKLSHSGIPKGLRLDPAYTKLTFLREIDGNGESAKPKSAGDTSVSAVPYFLLTDGQGRVLACNSGIAIYLDFRRINLSAGNYGHT
jgi:hypothetical protein